MYFKCVIISEPSVLEGRICHCVECNKQPFSPERTILLLLCRTAIFLDTARYLYNSTCVYGSFCWHFIMSLDSLRAITLIVHVNPNHYFNPFKPEFTIVIYIHYKPRIAVAILDL